MNLTSCFPIGLALALASCTSLDPEYAEYKKQKEAQATANTQAPFGQTSDPYGVPGNDPTLSDTGNYAPYQPLPSVNTPVPSPEPIAPLGTPTPSSPSPSYLPAPATPTLSGTTTPHQVVKGDSLWGLAKRYNTTEDAIRAANGIPAGSSTIRTGQTLQIPSP